jgi:hypothetical protein
VNFFSTVLFLHCIDMLHVMQIAELNDERNWRSGLRVQLLNTCMVTIRWILSITMRCLVFLLALTASSNSMIAAACHATLRCHMTNGKYHVVIWQFQSPRE